jgi:hypothetical protein
MAHCLISLPPARRPFVRHSDLDIDIHHVSFKDKETQRPECIGLD